MLVIMKSVNASTVAKSAEYLSRLLDRMIQKVGMENVMQVIIYGASPCRCQYIVREGVPTNFLKLIHHILHQ